MPAPTSIGPCLAKKAEAWEPDLAGAVDFVLTFQEIQQVFDFAGINPAELPEDDRDPLLPSGTDLCPCWRRK